jgi:uncharacterized membrane protein
MSRWLIVMVVLSGLAVGTSLGVWLDRADLLPEKVPVHWNAKNVPDGWVARDDAFWWLMIGPLALVVMTALAVVLPLLSPAKFKVESFRATWDYIMGLVVVMFFYLHCVILLAQVGLVRGGLGHWLVGGMLVAFAFLGNALGKVKRNFWMGVRTPWTLASDVVWERTHRVAAWLFVGGSLLGLVLLLAGVGGEFAPIIALVPFFVAAFAPMIYSLVLYKRLEKEGRLGGDGETRSA